jgi:hypothetical protein
MNSQLDLNIDKYSKEELIKLLGLQAPINEDKVTQAIDALLNGYTQKYQVNQNILQFFFDMKQKLLKKELTDYEIQRKKQEEEEKERDKIFKDALPTPSQTQTFQDSDRNVIKHTNLKTTPTYNQEVVADTLNPIKKRVTTKMLPIDTRFRQNYDTTKSTDFFIEIPDTIKNVVTMKLSSLEFPASQYNISDTIDTNTFTIIYNGTPQVVTIEPGNYSADELEQYLYVLVPPSGFFFTYFPGGEVGIEYDAKYAKFKIGLTSAAAATDTLELDFTSTKFPLRDIKYNLGWLLGYRKVNYTGLTGPNQYYTPEGIYDTGGTRNINVLVNDFNNNNSEIYINPFWSGPMKYNILARIQQPASSQDIVFSDNSDRQYKKRQYYGPVDIKRLKIQILNDNFEIIDINNMDYSLTLEFDCVYNL